MSFSWRDLLGLGWPGVAMLAYFAYIWRGIRKMDEAAMAARSVWHDDDITECDTEFYS